MSLKVNNISRLTPSIKNTLYFVCLLFILFLNMYARLIPAYFPQLKEEAAIAVEGDITKNIVTKVEDKYPTYNTFIKNTIREALISEIKNDRANFTKMVLERYNAYKDESQDAQGQTYLLESDPYQWMRYTQNIVDHGYPGDVYRDGDSYDTYMLAPYGQRLPPNRLFFYLSALLFKMCRFFLGGINLETFLFYLPLFYNFIFLISLYFFTHFCFSRFSAVVTVFFVGLNSLLLRRNCVGAFDYEPLVLMFPLLIVLFFSESLRAKGGVMRFVYALIASLCFGMYSATWMDSWWILIIVVAYTLLGFINRYLITRKCDSEALGYLLSGLVFFIGSIVFCAVLVHLNILTHLYDRLKIVLSLGSAHTPSIWPNTYYTVSELRSPTVRVLFGFVYGNILTTAALAGFLWVFLKERRSEKKDYIYMMFLWTIFMFFASLKSIRFAIFLAIPLGIFLAASFDNIRLLIARSRLSLVIKSEAFGVLILLFTIIGLSHTNKALKGARLVFPLLNDSWHKAFVYLQEKTPPQSIINTWWDYGNFLKVISKRRVIFDPQSQHRPLAYWMARVLVSSDEDVAIKILRMLNNSSDRLFDEINQYIKDDFRCVALIDTLLKSSEKEATRILNKYDIPEALRTKIINILFLHKPPPAYFMVEARMIHMLPEISFLGNWSFTKTYTMRHQNMPEAELTKQLMEIFSLSKAEAESIVSEMSLIHNLGEVDEALSARLRFDFGLTQAKEENNLVYFNNGIIFDLRTTSAKIFLPQSGQYKDFRYVYFYAGKEIIAKENPQADFALGCLIVKNENVFMAVGLSKELGESLFVKLFFMNGNGLKYFKPFYSDDKKGIYIYQIIW